MPDQTPPSPSPAPDAAGAARTSTITFADLLTTFRQLASRTEAHLADLAGEQQTDQPSPRQIELAFLAQITSVVRTMTNLTRLFQAAAAAPRSTVFEAPIAHLATLLAQTQARLDDLEARRRPADIPWLQRQ
jgi:hypothetical protein